MKKPKNLMLVVALVIVSFTAKAQTHAKMMDEHIMINTNTLEWKAGPASLPPGAQVSIIEGDLSKEGPFTARLKLPANYTISPHWHPAIEHVTVIDGSFYMGGGEIMDRSKATRLDAGGFAVMPIGYRHFAYTTEEAVIQLHGIGPWGITYVNSMDDPRTPLVE
jgi:hypothetical protein